MSTPLYDALEPRHQRFIDELLVSPSGTRAYERAFGTSGKAAESGASRLLATVPIRNALAEKRALLAQRTEITAERVIKEYARLAFSDLRKFVTWGPEGVSLVGDDDLTDDDARCVAEVGETKPGEKGGGSVRIKLHDKKGALDKLAEFIGINPDMMRKLYPEMDTEARATRVLSILRTAKERKSAAAAEG